MAKTTLEVIAELLEGLWVGLTGQLENLTNGTQKTQIVNADGDVVGSTTDNGVECLNVFSPDCSTTGSISTLNGYVQLDCHGKGSAIITVTGTWKGKIEIQGANDGTWNTLSIVQPTGLLIRTGINNDNQNGIYRIPLIAAYTKIRAIATAYTEGTIVIAINAASPVGANFVFQLNQNNLLSTVYQPTGTNLHTVVDSASIAALTNGSQMTMLTDGESAGEVAQIVTGFNTGVKGLRVFGGPTDPISDLPVYIDYDHHQIHEGETFRWSVYVSSLASGSNKDIRLVVPNITIPAGKPTVMYVPHFRFEAVADSFGQIFLYEGTTFSGNGTQRTPVALERNGTYTSQLEIYEDPTVNAIGTMIWQGVNFAAKTSAGSIDSARNEFPLKNNTSYCLRYTSGTTGLKVLIRIEYYEDKGV